MTDVDCGLWGYWIRDSIIWRSWFPNFRQKRPKMAPSVRLIWFIFSENATNLCNPTNLDDPKRQLEKCSMKCIDSRYTERLFLKSGWYPLWIKRGGYSRWLFGPDLAWRSIEKIIYNREDTLHFNKSNGFRLDQQGPTVRETRIKSDSDHLIYRQRRINQLPSRICFTWLPPAHSKLNQLYSPA